MNLKLINGDTMTQTYKYIIKYETLSKNLILLDEIISTLKFNDFIKWYYYNENVINNVRFINLCIIITNETHNIDVRIYRDGDAYDN